MILNIFKSKIEKEANLLVKKLHSLDKDLWLHIGHTLNSWKFPLEFYDVMPKWYLKNTSMKIAQKLINPVLEEIHKQFGHKEELRYHNVFRGKMSDLEFEYWYDNFSIGNINGKNRGGGDEYYDRKFAIEKLKWWEDEIWEKIKPLIQDESISNL